MNEEFISVNDREIIINTLSPQVNSLSVDDTLLIDHQGLSIENVQKSSYNFLSDMPHSTNKQLFKVKVKGSNLEKSFRLIGNKDEYFFAIQDRFLQLLDLDEIDRDVELFSRISPKIEVLTHSEGNNAVEAKINRRQMNYLINNSIEDREKISNQVNSLSSMSSDKSFYIVLNKFKSEPSQLGLFRLIEDGDSFRKEKLTEKPLEDDKPIAIIVHGLVSSIGASYFNLFNTLRKDYDVFGFEYLTVNERVRNSGILLANEVNVLKKKYPKKEILIVAHSMGGLVSRSAYIEQKASIDKIILAGTPNNGSILISVPMLARKCLILYGILSNLKGKNTIKSEDFWHLVRPGKLQGFNDLANNSGFISQLNSNDLIDSNKKYFALAGKNHGLLNDGIVHTDNMVTINEIKIPHTTSEWNHFTYFKESDIDIYLKRAINYLK
ncbi:alpha/beta hydrolase [Paenisporosarcina quisquiliarum]|uniref:Alpha/beta hydrolase n=1 Tax=Paenisporosarcina quisquiliarum TaxID=365346 RepID=A0A9X3LG33_9BACL|nr:alpha/beta hydrolase [Paenisporosarcina quisquiliarum]MCZ8537283.1 alpha/beta hydrolase [Paenisporosarcina quisquiliarum]